MINMLKTKTTWAGLLTIGAGVIEWVFEGDRSAALEKIMLGLGLIFMRHAISKNGKAGVV